MMTAVAGKLPLLDTGSEQRFAGRFDQLLEEAKQDQQAVETKVRSLAEQLVATTLILPILNEVQADPFRTEMFHGGMAEDIFRKQLDTIMADRIAKKADLPVVDVICDRIMTRINAEQSIGKKMDQHG